MDYSITGGKKLAGNVDTNISKNASVALLAASLLNRGTTTLKRMPRIEEVKRLIEVLESVGVSVVWDTDTGDMTIQPPEKFDLENINREAAEKTRSIALFIAPLAHAMKEFVLPKPGGCRLGSRTLTAHIDAFKALGIEITDTDSGDFHISVSEPRAREVVMYEASDTGTESILMAAAKLPGTTTIRFASANYMVQDLCVFLEQCGVRIEGIGTATLIVHGVEEIDKDAVGHPSEDPIESMFFISLAVTTDSALTIRRAPIDFLELELLTLGKMGVKYERGDAYTAENGRTRLADIEIKNGS